MSVLAVYRSQFRNEYRGFLNSEEIVTPADELIPRLLAEWRSQRWPSLNFPDWVTLKFFSMTGLFECRGIRAVKKIAANPPLFETSRMTTAGFKAGLRDPRRRAEKAVFQTAPARKEITRPGRFGYGPPSWLR